MNKTTPEEAKALADKHNLKSQEYDRLAALIDEVVAKAPLRGVDAEPVAEIVKYEDIECKTLKVIESQWASLKVGDKLYTHPAPSQPAVASAPAQPVELPVVAWFADDGDSQGLALKENVALRNCEPGTLAEALVKLSDAQAAIAAAGRKA